MAGDSTLGFRSKGSFGPGTSSSPVRQSTSRVSSLESLRSSAISASVTNTVTSGGVSRPYEPRSEQSTVSNLQAPTVSAANVTKTGKQTFEERRLRSQRAPIKRRTLGSLSLRLGCNGVPLTRPSSRGSGGSVTPVHISTDVTAISSLSGSGQTPGLQLSPDEFLLVFSRHAASFEGASSEELKCAFQVIDRTGRGYICYRDLVEAAFYFCLLLASISILFQTFLPSAPALCNPTRNRFRQRNQLSDGELIAEAVAKEASRCVCQPQYLPQRVEADKYRVRGFLGSRRQMNYLN
ncbi:unnamed protein product [Protopolystoma xenopodis]|uniref:EF-hand domain-containing protein n=1 Tax=Protopolystoma xenopodis TaxID=117903 RepID=A0A448WA47_9PLAT|nr:unnamed protein product [Protopolystoma xenopodis]